MKRHSSGKEGSKLTADRLYPKQDPLAKAKAVAASGVARVAKGDLRKEAEWKANAQRLREEG